MRSNSRKPVFRRGFSLVEMLMVLTILSIMAALAIPEIGSSLDESQQVAFVQDLRILANAAIQHRIRTGEPLEDASSGAAPEGIEALVQPEQWEAGTPIGGQWDAERDSYGIRSAVGVHFYQMKGRRVPALEFMQRVDALIDDGDITSGHFRRLAANRFYLVLEE